MGVAARKKSQKTIAIHLLIKCWVTNVPDGREQCCMKNIEAEVSKSKSNKNVRPLCVEDTFSSVQFSRSVVFDSATPWITARQASLFITNSRSPPKPMSIESVMPSSHLILCHPLLLLPPIFLSIRVFSNESALRIGWPKYWSFSFNISLSNEHPGLISFRMDWLDLLAVQGTLKSLLQHHSSKASILRHSAFFIVQLSHPYMTTGKTIALTRWTLEGWTLNVKGVTWLLNKHFF